MPANTGLFNVTKFKHFLVSEAGQFLVVLTCALVAAIGLLAHTGLLPSWLGWMQFIPRDYGGVVALVSVSLGAAFLFVIEGSRDEQ